MASSKKLKKGILEKDADGHPSSKITSVDSDPVAVKSGQLVVSDSNLAVIVSGLDILIEQNDQLTTLLEEAFELKGLTSRRGS